jgi:hypothetical protein
VNRGVYLYSWAMGARRLSVAAIVGLGLLAFAGSAQACSCAPMRAGDALRRADAAVVAKLLKVVPRDRSRADYRYLVQRVYKVDRGLERGAVISVRSARGGAACGLPEGIGRRYGLLLEAPRGGSGQAGSSGALGDASWLGGRCGVLAPGELQAAAGGRRARISALPGCTS